MTHYTTDRLSLRHIRSFVLRQGHFTRRQKQAMQQIWPIFGIDYSAVPVCAEQLFARKAPLILEIGFGMGASLISMAQQQPDTNFIGIEVHVPGIGACLADAFEAGIQNLRIIHHDAREVLQNMIADQTLDQVQIFFPDPWHKKCHHKRRIVQPEFTGLVWHKLKPGGVLHMATDWQDYARHMIQVISHQSGWHNLSLCGDYVARPASRPLTKFEQRGQRLGHGVWDIMLQKRS